MPVKKALDPLHDDRWESHQQRNLLSGDIALFQTEKYGTRARICLGAPLNEKEVRWDWFAELTMEEVAFLAADLSFTGVLLARKAGGAIGHLGTQLGVATQRVSELQGFIASMSARPAKPNGAAVAHGEALGDLEGSAPGDEPLDEEAPAEGA